MFGFHGLVGTPRRPLPAHQHPGDDLPDEPETQTGQGFLDYGKWQQVEMFAGLTPTATLAELEQHCKSQERMTANFAARDQRRRAHLTALIEAVNGDLTSTYAEAQRALRRQHDAA